MHNPDLFHRRCNSKPRLWKHRVFFMLHTYVSKDTTEGDRVLFWQINCEATNNKAWGNNICNGLLITSESRRLQQRELPQTCLQCNKAIYHIYNIWAFPYAKNSSRSAFSMRLRVSLEVSIKLILLVSRLRHKSKVTDKISDSAKHLSTCLAVNTCTIP